jgi:hypothetical protein
VEEVVTSAYSNDLPSATAGVNEFTLKNVGSDGTNYAAALASTVTAVNASSNGVNIVVFLSDGLSNRGTVVDFETNLADLVATGAVAYTFAVGDNSSCTGGDVGTLQQIAMDTGGTCAQITLPSDLPDILPDLVSTILESIEIEVDGGGKSFLSNLDIDPDLPQPGAAEVSYTTTVVGLGPGDHQICVTSNGSDSSGSASVTQCETIHLLKIILEPETATNELGTPGQEHMVTATILGPTSGPASVAGREVTFEVLSGPNAGANGTETTDTNGQATWAYAATQGPAGLGQDIIQACFTTASGEVGCATVTKEWADTTPPEVDCIETVNPHGNRVPPAGSTTLPGPKGGQNEDGFYELTATDDVWPSAYIEIFVTDTGSGTVFGPFTSEDKIKYTEDSEAIPEIKNMGSSKGKAGAIAKHIIGTGDACVFAVDGAGNVANCVSCLVPPLPK